MKIKINLLNFIFTIIIFNPLFNTLLDIIANFNYKLEYYRYLSIILICFFIILIYKHRKGLLFIIILVASLLLNLLNMINISNDYGLIYFQLSQYVLFILLLYFFLNNEIIFKFREFVNKRVNKINKMLIIIILVDLFMFISGLGINYYKNWNGYFFKGTSLIPHDFAYLMLSTTIISTHCYSITKEKKYLIYNIIFFLFILLSGARVALGGSVILYIIYCYKYLKKKGNIIERFKRYYLLIILTSLGLFCVFIFKDYIFKINIFQKFLYVLETGNFSNSRDNINNALLYTYDNFSWFEKTFGIGMDKTYYINLYLVKSKIWAHNDIMQILIGLGIYNVILYLIMVLGFSRKIQTKSIPIKIIVLTLLLFLAIFNGLYPYKTIVLTLPFLIIIDYKECKYLPEERGAYGEKK